jgi:hypothetical protein
MLTNKGDRKFTITELEVWQVKFLVIFNFKLILYRTEQDETQKEERRKRQEKTERE